MLECPCFDIERKHSGTMLEQTLVAAKPYSVDVLWVSQLLAAPVIIRVRYRTGLVATRFQRG